MTDRQKYRVEPDMLTLEEMAELAHLLNQPLQEALTGLDQGIAMAAVAWIQNRDTTDLTFETAKKLTMSDLEVVNTDPEALAANNGDAPVPSPVSGG